MKTFSRETPWGYADSVKALADGIISVSTPGHGGLFVSDELLEKMPDVLRQANNYSGTGSNWFEEDVEWALPVLAMPDRFEPRHCFYAVQTIAYYGTFTNSSGYMKDAAQWLAGPSGDPVRAKAATHKEES